MTQVETIPIIPYQAVLPTIQPAPYPRQWPGIYPNSLDRHPSVASRKALLCEV